MGEMWCFISNTILMDLLLNTVNYLTPAPPIVGILIR